MIFPQTQTLKFSFTKLLKYFAHFKTEFAQIFRAWGHYKTHINHIKKMFKKSTSSWER